MMDKSDEDLDADNCNAQPLNAINGKIHRRIGHVTVKYKNFIVVWGGYEVGKYIAASVKVLCLSCF